MCAMYTIKKTGVLTIVILRRYSNCNRIATQAYTAVVAVKVQLDKLPKSELTAK